MPIPDFLEKNFLSVSVSILVGLQLLLSFQGFDLCDEGFSLTFYQQFFNAPESVQYNFVYWLSGLIGGIWYQIFPQGGILWFRFLAIICNTATLILAYKTLKPHGRHCGLMLGLSMVLFINDFGFIVFYHNTLTAFLVVLAAHFFIKGLFNNQFVLLLISGVVLGVNISTRLTNVSMLVFVILIPLHCYFSGSSIKNSFKQVAVFFSGIAFGIGLVYLVLLLLNQQSIMANAIVGILQSGTEASSEHNISKVFLVYLKNGKYIFKYILLLILGVGSLLLLWRFAQKNQLLKMLWIVLGTVFFYWFFKDQTIYTVYAVIVVFLAYEFLTTKNVQLKVWCSLALCIAICLPLGSDMGIWNAGYMGIWLALPLALNGFLNFLERISKPHFDVLPKPRPSVHFFITVAVGFFIGKFYSISQQAYFDFGSRFDKTHAINAKLAKGILTSEKRANIVNNVLLELRKHVKPNDYLLAYESLPMLHFLTETKPYMKNPWILIYDDYSFQQQLDLAASENEELPLIVQQKFRTIFKFSEPVDDYLSEDGPEDFRYRNARKRSIKEFISKHNYKVIWSNAHFNIYKAH